MLLVSFVRLHWQMQGLEWGFTPKFSLKSFTTYIYLLNIRLFIMIFGLFYGFSFLFHSSICPYLCQYPGPHRWLSGKEFTCQCRSHRRCQFNPGVRKIPWKRKRQPTPVFLPGESHGQRSLEGYSPQGHKESDTREHALCQYHTVFITEAL